MASSSGSTGWFTKLAWLSFTILLLLGGREARAQAPAANAAAISGQVSAPQGSPAVSAQVRICPITATQATCTPVALLYTNSALTVQTQNPIATDTYGNYKVFVVAGLYLVQITVSPGITYTYYTSAGTSSAGGGGSSPPAYSVQYASNLVPGQFLSDPTIFITPSQHILTTPELFVPGSGTGLIGITGQTSLSTVYQTVADSTAGWTFTWPPAAPSTAGCIYVPPSGVASFTNCVTSGEYLPLSGGTLTGGLTGTSATFASVNTTVNAALDPTSGDIGAKITHAASACSFQCLVYVPAGNYTFSTTISLPLQTYGTYGLTLDPGAVLSYLGMGDAIQTPIASSTVTGQNQLIIQGGHLYGNASAANGVHIYPGNRITVRDMFIYNFTSGNGVLIEGANGVNVENNQISSNLVGVMLISTFCNAANPPTCSQSDTGGSAESPNNNRIDHNEISLNVQWGIWDNSVLAGATGSLDNAIDHNDLELNGLGTSAYGAVQIFKSVADVIGPGNYFEGSPRELVLGQYVGSSGNYYSASGPVVFGNFFTTKPPVLPATTLYNIELENTIDALIEGNGEQGAPGISSATNCFINAATGGETRTIISRNAIFQNATGGSGNQICVNGVGSAILVGSGSFTIFNPNFQAYTAFQNYSINSTVTSESIALEYVTATGSCQLQPVASTAAAAVAGRASYLAGTSYLSAVGAGGVTLVHPSGSAMTFDILCENNPTGSYGTP